MAQPNVIPATSSRPSTSKCCRRGTELSGDDALLQTRGVLHMLEHDLRDFDRHRRTSAPCAHLLRSGGVLVRLGDGFDAVHVTPELGSGRGRHACLLSRQELSGRIALSETNVESRSSPADVILRRRWRCCQDERRPRHFGAVAHCWCQKDVRPEQPLASLPTRTRAGQSVGNISTPRRPSPPGWPQAPRRNLPHSDTGRSRSPMLQRGHRIDQEQF